MTGNLPPKKEYSKQETDAAIETLALLMLRIRDGKIRGIVPNGTLKRLTDGNILHLFLFIYLFISF